jgi:ribosomal protein L32
MELKECQTCGASSFTNGRCDYCGNQYEVDEDKIFYGNSTEDDSSLDEDITFQETPAGKLILKIMIYTLVSIIWFAVTIFIPPLFIITIILLVVYGIYRLRNKDK